MNSFTGKNYNEMKKCELISLIEQGRAYVKGLENVHLMEVEKLRKRESFLENENRMLNNKLTIANQRIARLEAYENVDYHAVNEVEMSIGEWKLVFDRDTCKIKAQK